MGAKREGKARATAYDRYINDRAFAIVVALFAITLLLPIPRSMRDVGVEYAVGDKHVQEYLSQQLFTRPFEEVEQWQAGTVLALTACANQGITQQGTVLKKDRRALERLGVRLSARHDERYRALVSGMSEQQCRELLTSARDLRINQLEYAKLSASEQAQADRAARQIRICLAMVVFVIGCFLTEAIPLPGVAFCIGLILVFSGIVSRRDVAAFYWTDACWFIMGSLMFAAAFVKTGVDKRICLLLFSKLARPGVRTITLIIVLVIAPAASFISDHALAAMFLPIGVILYMNSLNERVPQDPELAKMLMICICMATNIGGFGSPSGGARNVIIMTYLEDMFGVSITYSQWVLMAMPFTILMIPILWWLLNWSFKPQIRDLGPALTILQGDIARLGGWNRKQVAAVVVFLAMLFGWITESSLLNQLLGFRLGIGVIAMAGAVAYLLLGIVNWRDYQEKVDWGVVWLYAGAIIFGKVLDSSGAAYWLARSAIEGLNAIGATGNLALLGAGGVITTFMTNLMADGPAAAAVGPVTLNMAAVQGIGTMLVPFMGLVTSCCASFAYLLIIGTPPNAIVYASGYLTAKDYLRVGIPCLIAAFVVMLLLCFLYWPLFALSGLSPM